MNARVKQCDVGVRPSMLKLVISVCALLATSAFAATHNIPEDGPIVRIDIPDDWQTKEVGESLQATAPAEPVHVLVVPPEGSKIAETMSEAMRYIRGSGGIVVKADTEKREGGKLNGMEARYFSWQAKDKNGEIKIRFTILFVAARKAVLVATWGPPDALEKSEADVKKVLESIKSLTTGDKSEVPR